MKFIEQQQLIQDWARERGIYQFSTPTAQALKAISEIGDHLLEPGGYLIGFNDGCGIIMSTVEWCGASYSAAHELASALNVGDVARCRGFSDWRVPTKDELDLAWINRTKLAGLGLAAGAYWSTTEHCSGRAWSIEFKYGMWDCSHKSSAYRVRFVRSVPMDDLITAKEDGAAAEANDGERSQKITTTCPSWIT